MKLQNEVNAKYKLKTIRPGKYDFPEYGTIDLRKININQADELVNKGFPFLELHKKQLENTKTIKKQIKPKEIQTEEPLPVNQLRKNKTYINKLLSMNWPDLSFHDKKVYNNSEKLFLEKKTLFIANSDMEREMRSLHTKIKTFDPETKNNAKRKKIIQRLAKFDDQKAANWKVIDSWESEKEESEETETEKAVRLAIEREKKIKANKIYIYRAEKMIPEMKTDTFKQREKIKLKKQEIERRKRELKKMGVNYE